MIQIHEMDCFPTFNNSPYHMAKIMKMGAQSIMPLHNMNGVFLLSWELS